MEAPKRVTVPDDQYAPYGTVLEAAFVDPAYQWPPPEGEGRNAIELQASTTLLSVDHDSVKTTESMKERMRMPTRPAITTVKKRGLFGCCKSNDAIVDIREYELAKKNAMAARKQHFEAKKQREKESRKKTKYNRVPEGILVYRLDTANQLLTLMSPPHSKTDLDTLVREIAIVAARPGPDKSRREIVVIDADGERHTLVACDQRTAIAWLEAIDLMLANRGRLGTNLNRAKSREWRKNNLSGRELDQIEGQYLNLANYSHKLIRSGKKSKSSTGGIYYSIEVSKDPADQFEEEALESIAKRRAVIKDSWDFYRMICSLLRDKRKYDEVFRRLQLDPVYPYLRSMTGLNDPGDKSEENIDKAIIQRDLPEYNHMTRTQVAEALVEQAKVATPALVEICKALAGSLGMEEVGVGPVKDASAALRKAERKYQGDLLKVTDFCRALLVVKDFPSLLALLELTRDSFGPLIRRVKLSTLKSDHPCKPGGYRDCIINLELKEHICEIQIHLWPMWVVCGVDGFRHYRHSLEYNTDTFEDPYDALEGLDRKTMAELIVMAEEAVADTPLEDLDWYQEKFILDYFAEVGLFMRHGLHVWAEITLKQLIRLRQQSPDIGSDHHETIQLQRYLVIVLKHLDKQEEAAEVSRTVKDFESRMKSEKDDAEESLWDYLINAPTEAYDMIMDPNKKEREEEEKLRREVKASKKAWRNIRKNRFAFLDSHGGIAASKLPTAGASDEKKDDSY